MKKSSFIFPGQGAQQCGMGRDFYENFQIARETFEEANDILGRDITKIIFDGPENLLTETRNCQVGLYINSIAILRVLQSQFPNLIPAVCAGLSLGEYTAITASQMLPFDKCLPLVQYRAQFMHDACEETTGTMAAILGLESGQVEEIVKKLDMPNDLWIANFNCPKQVVISGTVEGVKAGSLAAKDAGARKVAPLQVHGAFHSGLMQKAADRMAEKLEPVAFLDSDIKLVMNVTANFVEDFGLVKKYLVDQITHSVRWEESIRSIDKSGVDLFLEIGCGKVLAGLNKRIGVNAKTISISAAKDLDLIAENLEVSNV